MQPFFQKITGFFQEVYAEGRKIAWPERKELVDSSVVVIVFILILAIVVLSCDKVIQSLLNMIYSAAA